MEGTLTGTYQFWCKNVSTYTLSASNSSYKFVFVYRHHAKSLEMYHLLQFNLLLSFPKRREGMFKCLCARVCVSCTKNEIPLYFSGIVAYLFAQVTDRKKRHRVKKFS